MGGHEMGGRCLPTLGDLESRVQVRHMPLIKAPMTHKQGPYLATAGAQQSGGRAADRLGQPRQALQGGFSSYDTFLSFGPWLTGPAGDILELRFLTFQQWKEKD